jgi:hypothetical protein
MVFNGATMVRRKVETKRGKQEVVTPAKDEKETEVKGSGIAAEPVLDKKALQAKLRAELFKSL